VILILGIAYILLIKKVSKIGENYSLDKYFVIFIMQVFKILLDS
jgi:hypothetical protein